MRHDASQVASNPARSQRRAERVEELVDRPGFSLPLRNALAELVIAALEDDDAAQALVWLETSTDDPPPAAAARLTAVHLIDPGERRLLAVHAPHALRVSDHVGRALRAMAAFRQQPAAWEPLARAIQHAVALWNEQLFFEVHEVLEAVWRTATGDVRQGLQGVIQIAVAFHHLAHGNQRGARSLLVEGRARVASVPADALPGLDLPALLQATAPLAAALASGQRPVAPPPRIVSR
ncbi:MAG TPA: DUF309 domain-containing protein [Candidatus Nitrosopolaris sp.]|nr:DUF309 domain-containing protein [Candidatus Nitrosopolaris sp.]